MKKPWSTVNIWSDLNLGATGIIKKKDGSQKKLSLNGIPLW